MSYEQAPRVRLVASGLTVANFSSAHPFHFDTGEVLPACSEDRCRALALEELHNERRNHFRGWTEVEIDYRMSSEVEEELVALEENKDIGLILVPLPVLLCVRRSVAFPHPRRTKIRACRIEDRVKKLVSSTKFCV